MRGLVFLFLFSLMAPAFGAQIKVVPSQNDPTYVTVIGDIEQGDDDVFDRLTRSLPRKTIVFFSSSGGSMLPGLTIGGIVHDRGFDTAVIGGDTCASSCAMAWIAGDRRMIEDGSRVGFHSVFTKQNDGTLKDAPGGNALVGAYYAKLGLGSAAIIWLAETDPNQIRWLTRGDAQRLNIDVKFVTKSASTPVARAPAPASSPFADLTPMERAQASRMAGLFDHQYKNSGMSGINVSINTCYGQARRTAKVEAIMYCSSLDVLAYLIDSEVLASLHMNADSNNSAAKTRSRVSEIAPLIQADPSKLMKRATLVAVLAKRMIEHPDMMARE